MTAWQRRLFIATDEWAGILVLLFLRHDDWFWYFAVPWAVLVYGVSYPMHWIANARERKGK